MGDVPDRETLLAFFRESKRPVTLRDLQRALGLRSAARRRLQVALTELASEGVLERVRDQIYRARQDLPEVAVLDVSHIDSDGEVFARLADPRPGSEDLTFRIVAGRHAPKRGDRVLARLMRGDEGERRAQILRAIDKTPEFVVGVFESDRRADRGGDKQGGGSIRPADRRIKDAPVV
ncbi:MAG: hypothetical protein ACREIP_00560, partial [Alphaproteobacteria bacterium]